MTIVYTSSISQWTDLDFEWMKKELPTARVEKAARFYRQEDERTCILAGYMMEHLIGFSEIAYTAYGKPFAKHGTVHFNVAHSNGFVVVALSEEEIGVDCEWRDTAIIESIMPLFHEKEQQRILSGKCSFSAVWTAKEAYGKMLGVGLNYDLAAMHIERNRLYFHNERQRPHVYRTVYDTFTIAVCTYRKQRPQLVDFKGSVLYANGFC